MSDRKNKITKILVNAAYPTENEFNGAVTAFANSNMSLEQIESIAETLIPEYINETSNRRTATSTRARAGVF
jgi:hypothetical protein